MKIIYKISKLKRKTYVSKVRPSKGKKIGVLFQVVWHVSCEYCGGVGQRRVSDTTMRLIPRVSVVHSKVRYIKFEVYFIFQGLAKIQNFSKQMRQKCWKKHNETFASSVWCKLHISQFFYQTSKTNLSIFVYIMQSP